MHIYLQIYEFAASAGALEGYVYGKDKLDEQILHKWCDNLLKAYKLFPPEIRIELQRSCDGTIGRAIRSLAPILGENHEISVKLQSMISGELPKSANDFHKKKWFDQ